jgi:hypothetical protein
MEPTTLVIDTEIPIYIFWHIYMDSSKVARGIDIVQRQFTKIKESGLLERCTAIYIGYVSEFDFPCTDILNHPKVKIVVRQNTGYEGVTTTFLKRFCDNEKNESLILYIHNRGITHSPYSRAYWPSNDWTLMMEYFVIELWNKSIQLLTNKYTCGCELWSHEHRIRPNDFIFHYSGNFWWSRSSYIKLLGYPDFFNRCTEGEDWILELADHGIPKEHFGILHRTSKNRYERGIIHSYIDRYTFEFYKSGNETPDVELDLNYFHGEGTVNGHLY